MDNTTAKQLTEDGQTGLVGTVAGSEISRLASYLAREIFKCGDEPGSPTTRMQYKGGRWTPDKREERDQGGICEEALVSLIETRLRLYSPNTPAQTRHD